MAALKAFIRDGGAVSALGGAGNAFALTLSQPMVTRQGAAIGFFATRSNTGAVTMAVDATTAAPLRSISGTDLVSGQILVGAFYTFSWNSATSEYIINGRLTLALTDLPQIASNTVLSNLTGGVASPSANTLAAFFATIPANTVTKAQQEQAPTSTLRGNNSGAAALGTATITITIASPGVISWTAHGMSANDPFSLTTTGALPTGLSIDTIYYVSATGLGANSFQCSATAGGASINTSGAQSGVHTGTRLARANLQDLTFPALARAVSGSIITGVNPQTSVNYTIVAGDNSKLITRSNASAIGDTIPQAIGQLGAGFWFDYQNVGTSLATLTPTTSTIDGASSLTVPSGYGVKIVSDGTNYQIAGMNPLKGRVLLNTLTASISASLDDITSFTSKFSHYEIVLTNIVPATNNTDVTLRVHSGGAFQATVYLASAFAANSGGTAFNSSTTSILLTNTLQTTNTAPGASGSISISNPTQTTEKKMWVGLFGANVATSTTSQTSMVSGFWNGGNGVLTGFQVLISSGNITSGTVKVYGWN